MRTPSAKKFPNVPIRSNPRKFVGIPCKFVSSCRAIVIFPNRTSRISPPFTPHAGLLYANGAAMSVQPHPEFTVPFAHVCCEKAAEHNAPEALVATAKASLEQPLDNASLGSAIARFLARPRTG